MNKPQHYQVTLADAIAHYQRGDLTAKGLLHFYFKIRLKNGWILKETQKEITEKLGISRAAFYSALSKLRAEGSINWSAPANTKFSISLNSLDNNESAFEDEQSTNQDNQSTIVDNPSTIADNESTITDSASFIVTGEKTDPKHGKGLREPSYSSSYSSSNLLSNSSFKSLSDERERNFLEFKSGLIPEEFESFWDFAMYVAKSFKPTLTTEAIRLPEAWIKKYHQELYNQFLDGLEQKYGSRNFAEILSWEKSSGNSPIVENQAKHSPSASIMGQCKCSQCSPVEEGSPAEEEVIW